jgi:hypothetical protein
MHGAGVKRLALTLILVDYDVRPHSPHAHHSIDDVDDHYHVLHCGLPRLLAACPVLRLHLYICGSSLFVPCSFQVPRPPSVVCFPPRVTKATVVRTPLGSDIWGMGPFSLQYATYSMTQVQIVRCWVSSVVGPSYLAVSSSSWLQCRRGHCSTVDIP